MFLRLTRIRKRIFVVTGIVLLVIAVLVGVFAAFALNAQQDAAALNLHLGAVDRRKHVIGAGYDLPQIPSGNAIQNGSFEPLIHRLMLPVYDGDRQTIRVALDDADALLTYGDDFFQGASAHVYSFTQDGLTARYTGQIAAQTGRQIEAFHPVLLPENGPEAVHWTDFAELGAVRVAVGHKGVILRMGEEGTRWVQSGTTADITAVAAGKAQFVACTAAGEILHSGDGLNWHRAAFKAAAPLRDLIVQSGGDTAVERLLAVGDKGLLVAGELPDFAALRAVKLPFTADLSSIAAAKQDVLICGEQGALYRLQDDLETVPLKTGLPAADWTRISVLGNKWLLSGRNGRLALSRDGQSFQLIDTGFLERETAAVRSRSDETASGILPEGLRPDIVDHVQMAGQHLLICLADGRIYYSVDEGEGWQSGQTRWDLDRTRLMRAFSGGVYWAGLDGQLNRAALTIGFQLSTPLEADRFEPGDRLVLELKQSAFDSFSSLGLRVPAPDAVGVWYGTPGATFELETDQAAPDGGIGCLALTAAGQAAHNPEPDSAAGQLADLFGTGVIDSTSNPVRRNVTTRLTQQLSPAFFQSDLQNNAYRLEFSVRQEQMNEPSLTVWLSGLELNIETTVRAVDENWKRVSFLFVLPQNLVKNHSEIWLNIGFSGEGKLWFDRVWLGRASDLPYETSDQVHRLLAESKPAVLRLGHVPIGSRLRTREAWNDAENDTRLAMSDQGIIRIQNHNLGAALKLAKKLQANPWLTIDVFADREELHHVLEYLGGSGSTPYGKMRTQQGGVSRWTDSFSTLYFEIEDPTGQLKNDRMRANYVDYVIGAIVETPEYHANRQRIVFVDGMQYDDGVKLSTADYHATDLTGSQVLNGARAAEALARLREKMPRDPARSQPDHAELVRATHWTAADAVLRTADLAQLLLGELGQGVMLSLWTVPFAPPSSAEAATTFSDRIGTAVIRQLAPVTGAQALERPTGQLPVDHSLQGTLTAERPSLGGDAATAGQQELLHYAYISQNQLTVYVVNLSDQAKACRLVGPYPLEGSLVTTLDAAGQTVGDWRSGRKNPVLTLPAGGLLTVKVELESD